MKNGFLGKLIVAVFICSIIFSPKLYSKDKDDKEKKDKDEKIKDKDEKIKDEDEKIKTDIIENFNESLITSEIIYREIIPKGNNKIKKEIDVSLNENITKGKIKYLSESLEDLLTEIGNIKKDVRIDTTGTINIIREKYIKIKKISDEINLEGEVIFLSLSKSETDLILTQKEAILKSQKKITKILESINIVLSKKLDQEVIFNKTKDIENEIKLLTRQYRAISWILYEQ